MAPTPPKGAKRADKAPPKPGTKKYLEHFEARLREERTRVLKDLGFQEKNFDGESDTSAYSFHMADQGTDAMEREKSFLFASKEGRYLWHIDQALRRLYKSPETFGKCHSCGADIPFERLDALPNARYCIDCKQLEEREKGK
jgi:RNA polymerase-binding protein DksA